MAMVLTDDANYQAIADAIRAKNFSSSSYYPSEMAEAIAAIPDGVNINASPNVYPAGDHWTRPANYPDLDSIVIPADFDGVYLTYDLSRTPGWGFIGIYVNTPTASSGAFIPPRTLHESALSAAEPRQMRCGITLRSLWWSAEDNCHISQIAVLT